MFRSAAPLRGYLVGALIVAAASAALCIALALPRPEVLWRPFLVAFLSCWLVAMGGAALLAIGNLTGGTWAAAARPFYRALTLTIPLVAILAIPFALGLENIYPWAASDSPIRSELPSGKAAYLSPHFFLIRGACYLAIWTIIS